MPVSTANEEAKVLARKSSDISSGIPLKKRRFMMIHSSPPLPAKDPPPALSEGTDVKRNEESSSDLKAKMNELVRSSFQPKTDELARSDSQPKTNELVRSDSHGNEASVPGSTKEEAVEDVKNKLPDGINSQSKVESDSKNKEPSSEQGPSSGTTGKGVVTGPDAGKINLNLLEVKKEMVSAPTFSLSMDVVVPSLPEIRPAHESDSESRVEKLTELPFFTGQSAPLGALRSSGNPTLVNVKREMEGIKSVEDCNLKLSTVRGNDDDEKKSGSKEFLLPGSGHLNMLSDVKDMPASVLSLSLSKEIPSDGKIVSANRSNWDLNTTMDAWEGSNADAAFQSHVDGSAKKTESIHGSLSSGSISAISILKGKGKQVISTSEPIPSLSTSSLQFSEDSLSLTLSPSFHKPNFARALSGISTSIAPRRDVQRVQNPLDDSSIYKNTSGFRVVKSEPTDGNHAATSSNVTELLLDASFLKRDVIEKQKTQALTLTVSSPQNSAEQRGIKSEPTSEAFEGIGLSIQPPIGSSSSVLTMPVTPPNPSPVRLPASSELSVSADVSNQSEYSVRTKESPLRTGVLIQSATDVNPIPARNGGKDESFTDIDVGNTTVVAKNVNESKPERVKDPLHDLRANGEISASDEEKINISAIMEDEFYGSDYESDSNQALSSQLGKPKRGARDDEEYEDGEVRGSLLNSKMKNPTTTSGIRGDSTKLIADNNDSSSGYRHGTEQVQLDDKDGELKIQESATPGNINDNVRLISDDKSDQFPGKDGPSQNLYDGMAETVVHEIDVEICNSDQRKPVDSGGDKSCAESSYKYSYHDNSGQGIITAGEAEGEMFNTTERINSSYHIVEASSNDVNAAKDSSLGGSRSRIINLPRATSPSRTRSIPDKLLSSRNGRERYSDLDRENFYLRGNRDEMGTDGSHRFGRERFQDQPFRNSRGGYYSRGRGRFSGRHSNSRSEWRSNRDFSMGSYRDEYRFTRNKRELDCDDYVPSDRGGRGRGRKSLNDGMPSFRHQSSRRFSSPGNRDGPTSRGSEMVRRIAQNISPSSRRSNENGMEMVNIRHDDKFVRVLSDDMADHGYSRMYEGGDGQFIRGNRNLPTFQRRSFQRARSKSPVVGSRTWSSPRRRSPDGFNGLPQMFGVQRMRSPPDRTCFPEQQMVARRRSSPSYMARPGNDSRGDDPSRPINSSRRSPPPERVFYRSNRRLNPEEDYFGGNNGSSDERRKFGERRGISRPFKPTYMGGSEGGDHSHNTTRFHPDDGPRPMRFCSDADQEFSGRGGGGMREREFDGQMKNRQIGDPPRRMRNMDDPEASYRNAGQQQQQVWHEEGGFNEGSPLKRRRF